jgi:hypothetical protein
MWQKMEASLNSDGKKRKRRLAFIILFACLLTAGFFAANNLKTPAFAKTLASTNTVSGNVSEKISSNTNLKMNGTSAVNKDYNSVAVAKTLVATGTKSTLNAAPVFKSDIVVAKPDNEEPIAATGEEDINKNSVTEKIIVLADVNSLKHTNESSVIIKPVFPTAAANSNTALHQEKRTSSKIKKVSIEAIAGGDILRMNRAAGYYAGIRVNRMLEKGTVFSVGVSYSSNIVNDKYRLMSKPAEQWEADVRLSNISMIRLPVYFQRQMANSKFALMAGLIPSYVTDATVYNVPNSFTGNPDQYRKFTMKDINRFNVLFGAGIKYAPFNRIAFELSGSYGFTSLVKNSYANKSRVNDNFKSIQMGIVFKLK